MTVDYQPEPCSFCGAPENHPGPCPHLPGTLAQLEDLLAAVFLPDGQNSIPPILPTRQERTDAA